MSYDFYDDAVSALAKLNRPFLLVVLTKDEGCIRYKCVYGVRDYGDAMSLRLAVEKPLTNAARLTNDLPPLPDDD